jgi:hypothetical protein
MRACDEDVGKVMWARMRVCCPVRQRNPRTQNERNPVMGLGFDITTVVTDELWEP